MLCPVCNGRRETTAGQGCGACAATGFIAWPRHPEDAIGAALAAGPDGGLLKTSYGTVALQHGAAEAEARGRFPPGPLPASALIFLTIQQARGRAGSVFVSHRTATGFVISSTSADDESLVAWLIIE
jgi:hypothetical protein